MKKLEIPCFSWGVRVVHTKCDKTPKKGFRVNRIKRKQLEARKRRIARRLENSSAEDRGRPMFGPANIQYEMAERARGLSAGGIGAVHELARQVGLTRRIDRDLHLLKMHRPYHESDHVLNIALNVLSGGQCLEDLELRRNDEVFLDALGAERIPDPTTAGDFCRRFSPTAVDTLMNAIDETRLEVWSHQAEDFFDQATIDMDGTLVTTTGECKQGMDISYKGTWGYHPLLISLANTGEALRIVNRPGNRPSHEGAHREADQSIELCKRAGFRQILLRGDTDFTQTRHLDAWDERGVKFLFGMNVGTHLHMRADEMPQEVWEYLERPEKYEVKTVPRRRPENVKERIVHLRKYKNIRLEAEWVAECSYRPSACSKDYRMVVVCKDLEIENDPQGRLLRDYCYFIYLTNDWESSAEQIVFSANERCNQENTTIQQGKNGVRCFRAPLDNLVSNWAYMVMTALAWNLKAWWALMLPEHPRWRDKHRHEKQLVLRMEFKRFVNSFVQIPCQLVRTGRCLVFRLLAWNPYLPVFRRLLQALE